MLKYKVLLKITGSIAAYKSAYLVSKLVQSGYDVKVVMTEAAEKFIGSITFEALTGNPVYTDMFARREALSHISLMKWADIVIVAPATANTINAFVSGNGDNLVNTLFLAHNFKTPYLIAPAMNTKMFLHPATQNSLTILKSWGISILDSDSGYLACGDEGIGKLLDPDKIFDEIEKRLKPKKKDISVLITSGGTKENIDDVRFIANMSTGKTGASIADNLIAEGYNVTFLHAKDSIKPEANCSFFEFVSFNDLNSNVESLLTQNNYDAIIHLAAVSDYSVTEIKTKNENFVLPLAKKIKSDDESIALVLKKNFKIIDRIKSYSKNKKATLFGFKLVSGNSKLEITDSVMTLFASANADFIILNDFLNRRNSIQTDFKIFNKTGDYSEAKTVADLSNEIVKQLIV